MQIINHWICDDDGNKIKKELGEFFSFSYPHYWKSKFFWEPVLDNITKIEFIYNKLLIRIDKYDQEYKLIIKNIKELCKQNNNKFTSHILYNTNYLKLNFELNYDGLTWYINKSFGEIYELENSQVELVEKFYKLYKYLHFSLFIRRLYIQEILLAACVKQLKNQNLIDNIFCFIINNRKYYIKFQKSSKAEFSNKLIPILINEPKIITTIINNNSNQIIEKKLNKKALSLEELQKIFQEEQTFICKKL